MHRFFGYGSLVNAQTHHYSNTRPAVLQGWRRVWVHTDLRPVAYLSVEPAPGQTIGGLIADVPDGDWAALDHRERAYDRHPVGVQLSACGSDTDAMVYAVPTTHAAAPDVRHPVLLSYIDVVVQGFLRVFGSEGADAFFDTTSGWDAPILNDRGNPIYSRAQILTVAETALVDRGLSRVGARVSST